MDNSNSERGTGRTQRCIVRALSAGLRGETVVFVSADRAAGKEHRAYAIKWLTDNGFIGHHNVDVSPSRTILLGSGRVTFSMGESMSGPGLHCTTMIVEDHYVTECSARAAAAKAEKTADLEAVRQLLMKHGITHVTSPRKQYGKTYFCHL